MIRSRPSSFDSIIFSQVQKNIQSPTEILIVELQDITDIHVSKSANKTNLQEDSFLSDSNRFFLNV